MQRVEDHARRILRSDQEIEAGKDAPEQRAGGGVDRGAGDRASGAVGGGDGVAAGSGGDGVDERALLAREEELHAIVQLIVQRHLGDGCLDRDLALWPVDLADGLLDDALRFLVGIDQHRIVGDVRGDPDVRQDGVAAGGLRGCAEQSARRIVLYARRTRVGRRREGSAVGAAPAGGAPEAAVGIPLSAATGLVPDEETEMPPPGEIWLDALSRLEPLPAP